MIIGETPFKIPDAPDAAEQAKEFCRIARLGPNDVKIVRKDGFVTVVVKRDGAKVYVKN